MFPTPIATPARCRTIPAAVGEDRKDGVVTSLDQPFLWTSKFHEPINVLLSLSWFEVISVT